jgi:hypothetical protein
MATTLYFVQSDTLPQIKLTLTDEITNSPKDLTGKTVSLHAKPSTGTGIKFSRPATWIAATEAADRTAGIAYIQWLNGDLNRPAGTYTAEIEIYDSTVNPPTRETVYEVFNIVIREDIADIGPPYPSPAPTTTPSDGGNGGA